MPSPSSPNANEPRSVMIAPTWSSANGSASSKTPMTAMAAVDRLVHHSAFGVRRREPARAQKPKGKKTNGLTRPPPTASGLGLQRLKFESVKKSGVCPRSHVERDGVFLTKTAKGQFLSKPGSGSV